jgi:hypothetical protein
LDLATRPATGCRVLAAGRRSLTQLPSDALACATDASEVSCWWRERATAEDAEASVDRFHDLLQNLAEIQLLADAAATAVDASDDAPEDASTHQ